MDISKLLQLIPNSVSGDGKSFVAALKKFLLASEEDTDSKIEDATEKPAQVISVSLTEEHSVNDGTRVNTILVQWDTTNIDNYAKAEVWYKADNAEWAKAGESAGVQYRYEGVTAGNTYSVKVVAVNTKGNAADFDSAPQADISIKGSQYIPSAPTQFVLTWDDEGALWEWLAEDNGYIDFFELRLDNNPGTWSSKRLDSTREQHSRANPGVRGGTAYLYIRNIFGEYSEPAIHTFGKAMGSKPTAATLTATLDGVNIKMAGLPEGYTHYKLHIKTVNGNETIEGDFTSTNSEFIYFFFTGTISVSYCFVDDIGEGEYSDTVTANVKDLIVNADNIAEGAVTTDKLAANAVTAAKISANAITADKIDAGAVTADKVVAEAITADKLAVNSVTADAIQAGSVIGDKIAANTVTAEKIAANSITSNKIATGAITAEKIAVGAVTATSLDVQTLSSITAKIGELKTSDTGARIVIKDNLIEVYDENNVLRVRMGVW